MEKGLDQIWLTTLIFVKSAKYIYVGTYGKEESSWASHGAGGNKGQWSFAVFRLTGHLLLGSQVEMN